MFIPSYYYGDIFKDFKKDIEKYGIVEFYKKGEYLNKPGEYMDYSFYVVSGILRYYNVNSEGKEKTVWFIGADGIFPLYSPVNRRYRIERENSLVQAVTDVQVIKIAQTNLLDCMKNNNDFMIKMLERYADFSGLLLYESLNFSTSNNLTNVCNYLYHYETVLKPHGIVLTQEEMAVNIGTTPLNLARTLKTLREKGIISTGRKHIEIIDLQRLYLLCSGDIVP